MTAAPKSNPNPNFLAPTRAASTRKAKTSNGTIAEPQRPTSQSARTRSDIKPLNRVDPPDNSDLKSVVRHYAERETEALALKTLKLAKRGHSGALAFVFDSITQTDKRQGAPLLADLGSITRLDEIANAQRLVITSAAEGHITPADAIQYMKMLNELGEAIKNADLQAQIDELRSYVHAA